jgi:Tfp pilus assembly protein PilV
MRLSVTTSGSRAQSGFAMMEVLASLLVASFGVVALAGLQSRAASVELEANQRAQALACCRTCPSG